MATKTCGYKNPLNGMRDCPNPRWKEGATYCEEHEQLYRDQRRKAGAFAPAKKRNLDFNALRVTDTDARVSEEDAQRSHEYVPMPDLAALWHAVVAGAQAGDPAANLMFIGPSGSGKTDGARYLAALVGLPFTKVDAASMTDPEAWFGTRELVVQDGVAVTEYRPSTMVEAIQQPGVLLVDEISRVRDEHRNVWLPLLDATRAVMNPLTGEILRRHPMCFVIMAGNVGVNFTGTNAIDPAFWTRALTVEFDYIDVATEEKIVVDASECDAESAHVFVRFATETRAKAVNDPEFAPISTREVIEMGRLVKRGLSRDLAVKFVVLNAASGEGGSASIRTELQSIWNGVRAIRLNPAAQAGTSSWTCPDHGKVKVIPAGISRQTGKPYAAFKACPEPGCGKTEDKNPVGGMTTNPATGATTANGVTICGSCNSPQPAGRTTICASCGAAL